jgi:ribonuclease III family protein
MVFFVSLSFLEAEHQSDLLRQLKSDPAFDCTVAELQVLARGRNAVSGSSRNRRNPSAYQDATALEALIGYLFITDRDRCRTLLGWIRSRLDGTEP